MNNIPKNQGLIKLIVIVIIGILVLSYFGINIQSIAESPTSQSNFSYVYGIISGIWNGYLRGPVLYLWNDVFVGILWDTFKGAMADIKTGNPTNIQRMSPSVQSIYEGFQNSI